MSEARPSPVTRFLPSLTDLAFIMPLVFIFFRANGTALLLGDGDTGWHIRTGQWILENGRVPDHDIFSFSKPGEPWFAWEWLWDVAFGWLHQQFGMGAVVVASLLVISLTFTILFRLVRRRSSNAILAIVVTIMATAGSAMHWLARPHLFTLLFVAIFLTVLERVRDGNTRLLIALPFLIVLWANLHGGFFVGIILVGAYAAGELFAWLVEAGADNRRAALARTKPYALTALACGAASLVNPYTYHLHLHMYRFLSGSFHMQHIEEYQSTSFQSLLAVWFEPMLLLGVVAAAWSLYRKRFAHAFLVAGWAHLALISVRNMPIYLIVAAPVVAQALQELLERLAEAPLAGWVRRAVKSFEERAADFAAVDRIPRVYLSSALVMLTVTAVIYAPWAPPKFRAEYYPKRYPVGAVEALRDPQYANRIFTIDEWGDYLIYRLYPVTKVFIDGRFDYYGAEFSEKYIDLMDVKYGWSETLRRYGVDTVLLPVDTSLAGAMKESRHWRPVYDDGIAIVFRPAARIARASAPGSERSSTVTSDSGTHRDRKITKFKTSDPRITKSNTRSESL